ncbi:uncharacterized protein MONBRDRAFT_34908 [Monosiga brevicollis MX1]|uniref:pyridoxal kinase n=1 Tax=Monosiga brevicollis TaxID=81824 RepID=A9US49_MONBE|nr:uncharacterized protein MONBRDRAFT_34908 [Monosiga brevicollis MX1]EDQ91718.1 predicted protein [Monosiga brevicollis MX1]|eukprot:XP_001743004.1 hypothetical protein [Monosiga brevicollis MX1]
MSDTMAEHTPHILSIQSHVVSGYVGNRAATFPLQVLGCNVDVVCSVQFSNHTGFGQWSGTRLSAEELLDLYQGLVKNSLNDYDAVLTGYVGSAEFLRALVSIVRDIKKINPAARYLCDPVLGDRGKLYVPQTLVDVYKTEVVPVADVLTPNQFELELLSDCTIQSPEDALSAIDKLHEQGVPTVILTSLDGDDGFIHIIGSDRKSGERFRCKVPKIDFYFTGTGDLFAALILAWSETQKMSEAVRLATATLQAVCRRTFEGCTSTSPSVRERELRLIESKRDIETPQADTVELTLF